MAKWWVNANGAHSVSFATKAEAQQAAKSVWGAKVSRRPLGGRHAAPVPQTGKKQSLWSRFVG